MASSTGNKFSSTDQYSEDIVREFLHDVGATLAEDRSVYPCEANAVFKSATNTQILSWLVLFAYND